MTGFGRLAQGDTTLHTPRPVMPAKLHVRLSADERRELERLVRSGHAHARRIQHAHVLLLADAADPRRGGLPDGGPAWADHRIAEALACGESTVARTRRRYRDGGLEAALRVRKPAPGPPRKIDGAAEAHLIALACSEPPPGRGAWSLRLLADRFVALGTEAGWLDGPVSHETVRKTLKKTNSAPTASNRG